MAGQAAESQNTRIELHGDVDVAIVGDGNTVTIVMEGEKRSMPFLAPTRPAQLLIGRDRLKEELRRSLAEGYVAFYGMPGVGKTALALDLTYDPVLLAAYPDGVLWASLGPRAEVLAQLSMWASHVGLSRQDLPAPSIAGWSEAIHHAIGIRRFLLVVDDAWDADDALAFQVGGPNCCHVLTTRVPSVAFEFGGPVIQVPELGPEDGLRLIDGLAHDAVVREPSMTRELVSLVGGLPLTLTLLARHLRAVTETDGDRLAETAAQLRTASKRLALGRRQAPAGTHPGIAHWTPLSTLAVMELSRDWLTPAHQRAFDQLGVFPAKPSTFSKRAATAVADCDEGALEQLVQAGLLERARGSRFAMHQVVSDFASHRGGTGLAERRLAGYYVAALMEEATVTSDQFERDYGNVLAAMEYAAAHGMYQTLLQGMDAAYPLLVNRGLYAVAEPHLRHALEAARAVGDAAAEARTLLRLGTVIAERGDLHHGEEYFGQALATARDTDSTQEILDLLVRMGWASGMRGDLERSRRYFDDALLIAPGHDAIAPLQGLGWVDGLQGRGEDSRQHLLRGLELARDSGDPARIAGLLQVSGWMRTLAGDTSAAEAFFAECLDISRANGLQNAQVDALHGLGWAAAWRGQFEQARTLLTEALAIASNIAFHEVVPIRIALGRVLKALENYQEASHHLLEALDLARSQDRPEKISDALREVGRLELETGEPDKSDRHLRESLSIAERIRTKEPLVQALQALAELELSRGNPEAARAHLERALLLERANPAMLASLRNCLGEVDLAGGDAHTAVRHFRAALAAAERTGQESLAADCEFGLARSLAALGALADARQAAQQSAARLTALGRRNRSVEVSSWLAALQP